MTPRPASPEPAETNAPARRTGVDPMAEPLHRCAIHLLRLVRHVDAATGMSAARLSALSVLVFGGPCTVGTLARAEQVSGPTMTKLVTGLERKGWVRRSPAAQDARVSLVAATPKATRLLLDGRARRLRLLTQCLPVKGTAGHRALTRAIGPLELVIDSLAHAASASGKKGIARAVPHAVPRAGRRRID